MKCNYISLYWVLHETTYKLQPPHLSVLFQILLQYQVTFLGTNSQYV
jgi:hypothetical protein